MSNKSGAFTMDESSPNRQRFAKLIGFAFVSILLIGFVLLHFQPARKRGAKIGTLLAAAQSITVQEYRDVSGDRFYEDLLTEIKLTPAQAQELATIFHSYTLFDDTGKACLFEPHHQIRFTASNSSLHVIHVCFQCGDIALDDGPPFAMNNWEPKLRTAFEKAGVPIRQNIYRFNPPK